MRNWKRAAGALLLGGILLISGAMGEEARTAEVLELPEPNDGEFAILTTEEDPMIGPHEEGYLFEEGEKSPYGYADPSITVNVGTGRIYDTNYMYARVKIADAAQLRVMTAEQSLERTNGVLGPRLGERVRSVFAINGVLEADKTTGGVAFVAGPVMHQGVWKRPSDKTSEAKLTKWRAEASLDTLVLNREGDLVILSKDTWGDVLDEIEAMGDGAVNVITFGPALVVDGEPRYGYSSRQMATHRQAQRMAICQTGPLEYLLISSEGPEDPGSKGLYLDQFTELIASFPDVKTAYNLDGGASSTMVFRKGSEFWAKINCPRNGKKRMLRDLIYFADAWIPEETQSPAEESTP